MTVSIWGKKEVNELVKAKKKGMSWDDVAEYMNNEFPGKDFTSNSCRKKFKKIKFVNKVEDTVDKDEPLPTSSQSAATWTDDEMTLLYHLKNAGISYPAIAKVLKKSIGRKAYNENMCRKKWNGTSWDEFLLAKQEKDSYDLSLETEKQRVINRTLANQEKIVKRDQVRTEIIIDNIKSAIYKLPKPRPSITTYTPAKDRKYSEEEVGVMISDLHVGASFTDSATGGLGEYNLSIFKQRMNAMKESLIKITERHRLMYSIKHLHVFCLGDIIAGMNDAGDWSPVYIDMGPVDQAFEGVAALRDTIAYWASAFEKVTFYGVYGNHGRVSRRGVHKYSDNWDRVVYKFLEQSMSEYDNIEWNIPETWYIMRTIQNHNFYIVHGDGIKGQNGIPYYGVEKSTGRVAGLFPQKPDYTLMGHFHSTAELSTNFGKVLINGSYMGGDMFSIHDLQKSERPEQKIFGIHPEQGITWMYNIQLDK